MTNILKSEKFANIIGILKTVYFAIFTVYLITREITALNYFIDSLFVTGFFVGMAALFIGYDLLTNRYCLKTRYLPAALLFLTITVISCIINYNYGIFSNMKGLAAFVIYLFLIYPDAFKEKSNTTLNVISYTACLTLCIYTLASIPMYFYNVYYYTQDHRWQGFLPLHDRLWGLYQEPGYASLYALITICLSVLLFSKTKSIILKILLVFCDLVQIIFISLGGSRMATLAAIIALIWASFVFVFKKLKVKVIYKALILLLCITVSIFAPLSIISTVNSGLPLIKRAILKNGTPQTYVAVHEIYDKFYTAGKVPINVGYADEIKIEEYPFEDTSQTVDRSDNPAEISNGRFARWLDGIKVLIKSPIFGTSPRNIVSFAKDFASNTLMGKSEYSIHNTYLEILTGVGIFGGIAILAFLVLAAIYVIKIALDISSNIKITVCSIIVLIIAFSAILLPDIIFFQTTFAGFLFWLSLGHCLNTNINSYKNSLSQKLIRKLFKKES